MSGEVTTVRAELDRLTREAEELCLTLERLTGRDSTDPQTLTLRELSERLTAAGVVELRVFLHVDRWRAQATTGERTVYAGGWDPASAVSALLREVEP